MARRASRRLHQSLGLTSSTAPPTLPWCGTFHSVAARLLREEAPRIGLAPGFTVLGRAYAQDLMTRIRRALGLSEAEHLAPTASTCLALHFRCVNKRQPLAEVIKNAYPWCLGHEADLQRHFAAVGEAQRQHSSAGISTTCCWPGAT
jgi:DNA helicase-2/ATP-dependent DNA helicase PcrA